ncbi:GMC oxidoreductase [Paenibacillus sinopodophylli]
MGVDPSTSVTNPSGQVHGIVGLYVADNSVISTSGLADEIAKRLQS